MRGGVMPPDHLHTRSMRFVVPKLHTPGMLVKELPMTRRTQAERTDATTAQLVAAAGQLFGQDGYAATSIDAIAAAAGLTKGAAYHHFPTKAALFHVVFVHELEQVTA